MSLFRPLASAALGQRVYGISASAIGVLRPYFFKVPQCACSTFSNRPTSPNSVAPSGPRVTEFSHRSISTSRSLLKKSKKSRAAVEEEEEDRDEDDELEQELLGKGDKILEVRLASDRIDAVLKAGLGMSRNKIEKAFYSDRVRVNGERPKKKSQSVDEGDEVDFIRRYNAKTPEYLDVSRLEILKLGPYPSGDADDDEFFVPAKIRRAKNLTIENYDRPFRGNITED